MCLVWGTRGVVRDEQIAGDLRPAQLTVEQPGHLKLPVAPQPHHRGALVQEDPDVATWLQCLRQSRGKGLQSLRPIPLRGVCQCL